MTWTTSTECPSCGEAGTQTTDSRVDKRGWRRRRRLCVHCKHKWSTLEIQETELDELMWLHDRIKDIHLLTGQMFAKAKTQRKVKPTGDKDDNPTGDNTIAILSDRRSA